MRYAPERLYEEIAYVAYHFHWSLDDILDLDHLTRRKFINEIANINRRLSDQRPAGLTGPIFGLDRPFGFVPGQNAGGPGGAQGSGQGGSSYGLAQL